MILALIVLPVGWLAWQSIYHDGFTLENYRRVFTEDIYWRSFALTFEISLAVTVIALLLGYPVAESEDMPDIAADAMAIAFGDFSRGYLIVDRAGIRVLRDPYSAKPYVLFYTTKRVGGGVQDFEAIKLLKFGA